MSTHPASTPPPARPAASAARAGLSPIDLVESIETVLRGKREAIETLVVGALAEGHVLIEDVPGTGKTTLARAFARSLDASFSRIQFTSDLLPADVLGVSVWSPREEAFRFQPGPIFAQVVLADELNRTPPRTQSGLLECMSTGKVSIDGQTRPLPTPFVVVATQNPLEFEGTYPLPESQLDRFLLRLRMGYPDRLAELELLRDRDERDPLEELRPVASLADLEGWIRGARAVRLDDSLYGYVLDLIEATRASRELACGASPRAALGLVRAAKARAFLEGREFVVPDDVKRCAVPCLAHRLVAVDADAAALGGGATESVVTSLLERVDVPL